MRAISIELAGAESAHARLRGERNGVDPRLIDGDDNGEPAKFRDTAPTGGEDDPAKGSGPTGPSPPCATPTPIPTLSAAAHRRPPGLRTDPEVKRASSQPPVRCATLGASSWRAPRPATLAGIGRTGRTSWGSAGMRIRA
jgi:hypothetical protein